MLSAWENYTICGCLFLFVIIVICGSMLRYPLLKWHKHFVKLKWQKTFLYSISAWKKYKTPLILIRNTESYLSLYFGNIWELIFSSYFLNVCQSEKKILALIYVLDGEYHFTNLCVSKHWILSSKIDRYYYIFSYPNACKSIVGCFPYVFLTKLVGFEG